MNERKELLRKALLKRKFRLGKKKVDKFLSDKTSFNDYIKDCISHYSGLPAITDKYNGINLLYEEFEQQIENFATGLQFYDVRKSDFVCIFTENNGRWAITEQAAMRCGAVAVLRGSTAPVEELDYIIGHSDAKCLILKDAHLLNAMKDSICKHSTVKFVVLMFKKEKDVLPELSVPVYSFDEILLAGEKHTFLKPDQNIDEPCLMLYTSGTTGLPKGVLITHKNILAQIPSTIAGFSAKQGENTLHILPVWHAYEQMAQTYFISAGCHLHFTTLTGLKNDLQKGTFDAFMSVPRIWEAMRLGIFQKLKQKSFVTYALFDFAVRLSVNYKIHKMYSERRITNKKGGYHRLSNIYHNLARSYLKPFHIFFTNTLYKKIRTATGMNFRASISGGGALSLKDQLFYDAIGVNLREGYGLTETSPVLTLRFVNSLNFLGCCGEPIYGTEIKIIDIETKKELGILQKGVVLVRGYQVMNGYYKNTEATKEVLSDDGWFNTGDIGWLTADNNLVLVGRLKETIVLSNGENVEPVPLEEACLESPYIEQIMLVGQDKATLGALVVPSEEALKKCGILAKELKTGSTLTITNPTLRNLIKKEIDCHIKNKQNFKSFEQIRSFEVLKEEFSMSNGMMSRTAKIKRNIIFEKYKKLINGMFDKNKGN